jgi:hypothetical protein
MDFNSIFSFEPVSYIIGLIVTVNLLYTMTHKPVIYSLNKTQKMFYFPIGVNFFYWTEQTSIFQYFGNLTFNSFPLYYKIISRVLFLIFIFKWILIGTVAWTVLFGAIMKIRDWVTIFSIPFIF